MKKTHALSLLLLAPLVLANEGGCQQTNRNSAARREQTQQNAQQDHMLRTQPVPAFQWSLERHLAIEIYKARQRHVPTTSLVQSDFTGKVMWQCDSIGFPLPYATQLTNPQQGTDVRNNYVSLGVTTIGQAEPNGLYSPASADGTWVPCVDDKGNIAPVYEERKVSVFPRRVVERDGRLVQEGPATLMIETKPRP